MHNTIYSWTARNEQSQFLVLILRHGASETDAACICIQHALVFTTDMAPTVPQLCLDLISLP